MSCGDGSSMKPIKKTSLCIREKPGVTVIHDVLEQGVGTGTVLFAFASSCCCCIET